MARQQRELPKFDPWTPYQIQAHNKKYTGDANGLRFVDGLAVVNALPEDEDLQLQHEAGECSCAAAAKLANTGENPPPADECQERVEQLMWFWNAAPLTKKVPIDPSDPESDQEWRTFTTYLIEPYDSNARRRPARRNVPITAREMDETTVLAAAGPARSKGGA